MLVRGGIICLVEKKLGGCAPEFIFGLPDRGERRRKDACELHIIVAYQSHITGDGDPTLNEATHQPKRQAGISTKNTARPYPPPYSFLPPLFTPPLTFT